MIYLLILFVGVAQPLGWFHKQKDCVDAAREIAVEVELSPDGADDVSCVSYEVMEERKL